MTEPLKSVVFPSMKPGPVGREAEAMFLRQSNLIEEEPGPLALIDAWEAWRWLCLNVGLTGELEMEEVLGTHENLMNCLWPEIAGKLRTVRVAIPGKAPNLLPPPEEVERQLLCLLKHKPETEADVKDWHVSFESIHPFRDGNGRTGRILMNWQRVKLGLPLLIIPARDRYAYYEWFQ